jgi:hypothetical protein
LRSSCALSSSQRHWSTSGGTVSEAGSVLAGPCVASSSSACAVSGSLLHSLITITSRWKRLTDGNCLIDFLVDQPWCLSVCMLCREGPLVGPVDMAGSSTRVLFLTAAMIAASACPLHVQTGYRRCNHPDSSMMLSTMCACHVVQEHL